MDERLTFGHNFESFGRVEVECLAIGRFHELNVRSVPFPARSCAISDLAIDEEPCLDILHGTCSICVTHLEFALREAFNLVSARLEEQIPFEIWKAILPPISRAVHDGWIKWRPHTSHNQDNIVVT